jgi:hypothetical protein
VDNSANGLRLLSQLKDRLRNHLHAAANPAHPLDIPLNNLSPLAGDLKGALAILGHLRRLLGGLLRDRFHLADSGAGLGDGG